MTFSYNTYEPGEDLWEIEREYYYSIGDNNTLNLKAKSLYLDEKAYSYSEALELTESWDESFYLEELEKYSDRFDLTTEQGKIDCISFLLSYKGIFLDKSIDYQTAINKYIENYKKDIKDSLDCIFFSVIKPKFSKNEDGTISIDVPDSATFLEILSWVYGPFYISSFCSDYIRVYSNYSGYFHLLPAGDGKTISGKIYAVDETKIYGVIEVYDTYTNSTSYTQKVEFPYTTEGTGKNTIVKVTYARNTYTLTYDTYDTYNFVLCPATSVTSAE